MVAPTTGQVCEECVSIQQSSMSYRDEVPGWFTWPSTARSTSGWLGGRTSFVEPMTGQAVAVAMLDV